MIEDPAAEPEQAPYKIEAARSGRSSCKSCKRKIAQDAARLGVLIDGPFGPGYLWFHLTCAARQRLEDVEEAYARKAWPEGLELPTLDELRKLHEKSSQERSERRTPPWVELDPSGRAKCKHCGEPMEKGSLRLVLSRAVEFYNQVRNGPIHVHTRCVVEALGAEDNSTPLEGFREALIENSQLEPTEVERALVEIGPLPAGD